MFLGYSPFLLRGDWSVGTRASATNPTVADRPSRLRYGNFDCRHQWVLAEGYGRSQIKPTGYCRADREALPKDGQNDGPVKADPN